MDGKACVVVGVECGDDEGELDSRDGTGAGEEEVAFVISVREGTEGCGGGSGDEIGGGGGHCCAAVRRCGGGFKAPRSGSAVSFSVSSYTPSDSPALKISQLQTTQCNPPRSAFTNQY